MSQLQPNVDAALSREINDVEIWSMRAKGHSPRAIAAELDLTPQHVRESLARVAEEYKLESATQIIKLELDRLDILLVHAMEVLEAKYTAYSHGKMMVDEEGNTIADPAPVLHAINAVLKIMDRRSKYLGLDAPTKSEKFINVHKDATPQDMAVLALVEQYRNNALALTPEALEQAHNNAQQAITQSPEHEVITLPSDHFSATPAQAPATEVAREHA